MTKEKIRKILDIYKEKFSNYSPQEYPYGELLPVNQDTAVPKHALAMIDKIEKFLKEDKMERALIWFGFIQCCVWTSRKYTVQDLKKHTRL